MNNNNNIDPNSNFNKDNVFVFKNRNPKSNYTVEDLLDKAGELMEKYELELACKFFEKAQSLEPNNTLVMDEYAMLLLEMGEMEKAKQMLLNSVKIKPEDNHSKYMTLGQLNEGMDALRFYEMGIKLLQRDTQLMQKERKLSKEETFDIRTELSNAYCSVAELYLTDCCFENNAEQECEKAIKRALELDAKNPEALQCYANFLISKQQPEEAAKHLKQSIAIWSKNKNELPPFPFRVNTCKLLIELNCHKDAIPILERLLKEDNEIPENWYLLSLCYYDQLEDCRTCLVKASKLLALSENEEDLQLLQQIKLALKNVKKSLNGGKEVDENDNDDDDDDDDDDEEEDEDLDNDGKEDYDDIGDDDNNMNDEENDDDSN